MEKRKRQARGRQCTTSIAVRPETKIRLAQVAHYGETMDLLLNRLLDASEKNSHAAARR